jgi:hypothetical protein
MQNEDEPILRAATYQNYSPIGSGLSGATNWSTISGKSSRSILLTAGRPEPMTEKRGAPIHRLSIGWKPESITASALSFQTKILSPALI